MSSAEAASSRRRRITTDVYLLPLAEQYLVYAPLRRIAFLANADLVDLLWRLREAQIENLNQRESGLLRFFEKIQLLGQDGDSPIQTYGSAFYCPTHVTLFLTNRCNLHCSYCYASAGSYPQNDMPFSLARRAIDVVVQNARSQKQAAIGLSFHGGGEPTLNWKVLQGSLDYAHRQAQDAGLVFSASMASNGVWGARQREWLLENLNALSLSWDGLPAVQDAQRPTAAGARGSSAAVWRTIEALEEARFAYGIRMTATAFSVDRLAESIEFLLRRARPQRIQVEPVYDLGRGQGNGQQVDLASFVTAYREARLIAAGLGIDLFFSGARLEALTNRFCRGCGEGFSITASGEVSACFEVSERTGSVSDLFIFGAYDPQKDDFILEEQKLEALRNRTVEQIPWCRGCFARWHCAGDCQHKAERASLEGVFAGHPRCDITRALLQDQILEKIQQSGGTFWVDGMPGEAVEQSYAASMLAEPG